MRRTAVIGTSILGLLLGTAALASSQHGNDDGRQGDSKKHEDNKHEKEPGRSSAKPVDKHEAAGQKHQPDQRAHEPERANHNQPEHQQPHIQQGHGPERVHEASLHEQHSRQAAWEGHRAQHWEHEHHSWRERGGYRGYRIPDSRFRAHFGREHWFRVHTVPLVVVGGYPRFQYSGLWFSMVDPWPEYWSRTWYQTDDVYVDYVNDGYYMYNRSHPGVGIAINVSL
jgi:hypothetical protein